ncbi:hypothetical protein G9A89_004314 [Geosiphon pyriformis]|nr:hypothetical protein G9A89_004314 [Geosiphon pyriformis]
MSNYSYLLQQSEEHFEAHNKNNLDFIELNPLSSCLICFSIEEQFSKQFQDFQNWFLNEHSAETYTAYTTYYFDQAYLKYNFEERNNITPEPMTQDLMQQNILIVLQGIQTALGQRNNTPLSLFRGNTQDLIKWLNDFERAVTANQYDEEYKIIRWIPTNAKKENTFFIIWFETKFRIPILISKWHMELKKRTQGPGKVVTKYAKAIKKLIKHVNSRRNWTEKQKIYFFTKELKTNLLYALWPFLVLKDNSKIDIAIELAQKIEDSQKMHLESTLLVFVLVPAMAPVPQIAATSFATHTQNPNEQLINRLTANLQLQRPKFEFHFNQDCNNPPLLPPIPKNNNNQNNRTINNNAPNQKPNHTNINFFGEDLLVEATSESASQPEENLFYIFNLTDNDHNIDKLAINTSDSTRKKKKAKIDFVLDPNKVSTFTTDNNELPKTKVFKNSSKLESSEILQKSGLYSVVKKLMKTPVYITFGQLMTHLQFKKDLHKSLIPKKKIPKTNKHSYQTGLADNSNITPLICKVQVAGYFIDLILDSELSVSVIAKHFLEAIGRKIDKLFTQPMTNIHGDKKKDLNITKAVSVHINSISIETDMEVSKAKEYTIIVGNEWLKKAKTLFDYVLCKLTIRCSEKLIVVKCYHWTTSSVIKQNQEEKQSNKSDDNKNDEEKDQKEQEKTAKFVYTIFTSNSKLLKNVKVNKKKIMVNDKLIC